MAKKQRYNSGGATRIENGEVGRAIPYNYGWLCLIEWQKCRHELEEHNCGWNRSQFYLFY